MINPAELRFGNWINEQGLELQVGLIQNNLFENSDPIPLTEEWLLKFGFTQHHGDYYNTIMMFKSTKASRNEWLLKLYPKKVGESSEPIAQRFYFVHQLQNLYFALTNFELNIDNGK